MHAWLTARPMRFSATFPSACREGTEARYLARLSVFFSGFHILAQDGVHRSLVAPAVLAKECQHVGINPQGDLLLRAGPEYCVLEEVRAELRRVGKVDVLIPHRVNSLPNDSR